MIRISKFHFLFLIPHSATSISHFAIRILHLTIRISHVAIRIILPAFHLKAHDDYMN